MSRFHTCHARGCPAPCAPQHLMCSGCWAQVPKETQQKVYAHYTPGQCNKMSLIKKEWVEATREAIMSVPYEPVKREPEQGMLF